MALRQKLRIGGGSLVLAGLVLSWFGVGKIVAAREAGDWPTTTGTIERSWVEQRAESRAGLRTLTYRPRVEYTYEVDGRAYASRRISIVEVGAGFRSPAYTIVHSFPEDAEVTVHYRGDRPSDAVLVAGVTADSTGLLLLGLTLIVIGSPLARYATALARYMAPDCVPYVSSWGATRVVIQAGSFSGSDADATPAPELELNQAFSREPDSDEWAQPSRS